MSLTIALDVDDTLADLSSAWVRLVNETYGSDHALEEWTDWDLEVVYGPIVSRRFHQVLEMSALYAHVEPIPGAYEAVHHLRAAGHRIVFVTRELDDHAFAGRKWRWLLKHGFATKADRKNYLEMSDKSLVRADVLIDDGPHNCIAFPDMAYLIDKPWNRNVEMPSHVVRVPHVAAVQELLCATR